MSIFNQIRQLTEQLIQLNKKREGIDFFENCVREIYDKKITTRQFSKLTQQLQFDIGYGGMYSLIRERLQAVCKNHRILIAGSAEIFYKNMVLFQRTYNVKTFMFEEQKLKLYEVIAFVIYHHFRNIAESNRQICQLWQILKQKQKKIKSNFDFHADFNIRAPELKLSTLNLLALKQLIPPSDHVNFSEFKQILFKLKNSPFIARKSHLQELMDVYDGLQNIQINSKAIQAEKEMTLPFKKQLQPALVEEGKQIVKQTPKAVPKQVSIKNEKPTQKQKQKQRNVAQIKKQIQSHFSVRQQQIDSKNWLRKSKQDPIGKRLAQRFGGKFCQLEDEQVVIKQQDKEDLQMGIFPKSLLSLGMGMGMPKIKFVKNTISVKFNDQNKMEIIQKQSSTIQIDNQFQNELQNELQKQLQNQQTNNNANGQKKKKKKNKKKKNKQNQLVQQNEQNQSSDLETQLKKHFRFQPVKGYSFIKQIKLLDQPYSDQQLQIAQKKKKQLKQQKQQKQQKQIKKKDLKQKQKQLKVNQQIKINKQTKISKEVKQQKEQKQNKNIQSLLDNCKQTIKFLKQMTIDDAKRSICNVESRRLQDWRRWAQKNSVVSN